MYAAIRLESVEENHGGEAFRRFHRMRRQMVLLFPPEAEEGINAIEKALQALAIAAVARERPAVPGPEAAQLVLAQTKAFSDASMKVYQLQDSLMWLVSPYLRQYGLEEVYGAPAVCKLHAGRRRILSAFRRR